MKKSIIIVLVLLIIAVIVGGYYYDPYFITYQINQQIDFSGIELMMTNSDVEGLLGPKEEYVQGMGGYLYRYDSQAVSISFSNDPDGFTYDKVTAIETENPEHSLYGLKVGSNYKELEDELIRHGFKKPYETDPGYFKKGNLYIMLTGQESVSRIKVGIIDRKLKGRVY